MSNLISRTGRVQSWIDDPTSRLPVSCTIFKVDDSCEGPEGIEASWRFASHALRNGAGVAIHLSELRAKGTENGKGLVASGPVSFGQIYSTLNSVLRRGGVYKNGATYGLAILSFARGSFQVKEFSNALELRSEILRINPSEILVSEEISEHKWLEGIEPKNVRSESDFDLTTATDLLCDQFEAPNLAVFGIENLYSAIPAAGTPLAARQGRGGQLQHSHAPRPTNILWPSRSNWGGASAGCHRHASCVCRRRSRVEDGRHGAALATASELVGDDTRCQEPSPCQ